MQRSTDNEAQYFRAEVIVGYRKAGVSSAAGGRYIEKLIVQRSTDNKAQYFRAEVIVGYRKAGTLQENECFLAYNTIYEKPLF